MVQLARDGGVAPRKPVLRTQPQRGTTIRTGAPVVTGSPARGTTTGTTRFSDSRNLYNNNGGSTPRYVTVNGQRVTINSKGIINTPGRYYGKYPAQVRKSGTKPVSNTKPIPHSHAKPTPRPVGASAAPKVAGKPPAPKPPTAKPGAANNLPKMQKAADDLKSYMAKASAAVQAELAPALNDLNRQIKELTERGLRQGNEVAQFGRDRESDLASIFSRLGNFTSGVQLQGRNQFNQLENQVGANYDQLNQNLGQTFQGAQGAAQAESARLGLTGTAGAAEAGIARDQNYLQGLAGVDRAAATTGMANSQNSFNQLMNMARTGAATEGTIQQGQARRDTAKTLSDLMFEMNMGQRDLRGQIGDIEQTRGEKVRQLAEALGDKDYARNMERSQLAFEQDLANKRFGLEQRQVDASLAPQPVDYLKELQAVRLQQEIEAEAARVAAAKQDMAWQEQLRRLQVELGGIGGPAV